MYAYKFGQLGLSLENLCFVPHILGKMLNATVSSALSELQENVISKTYTCTSGIAEASEYVNLIFHTQVTALSN